MANEETSRGSEQLSRPTIRVENDDQKQGDWKANDRLRIRRQPTTTAHMPAQLEADGSRKVTNSNSSAPLTQGTSKTTTTTTTVYTTTTNKAATELYSEPNDVSGERLQQPEQQHRQRQESPQSEQLSVAVVEDLGKQAAMDSSISVVRRNLSRQANHQSSPSQRSKPPPSPSPQQQPQQQQPLQSNSSSNRLPEPQQTQKQPQQDNSYQRIDSSKQVINETLNQSTPDISADERDEHVPGNRFVTTISTIVAQSSQSRVVLTLLKDGDSLQLKMQEMRPAIFEVGANYAECAKYLEEHQKLMSNLCKQRQTPIDGWLVKYEQKTAEEPKMSTERKLVYMCMVENLQGCWKALLNQLDQRSRLLDETVKFYESAERVVRTLDKADHRVEVFRRDFLSGPGSIRFEQAYNELKALYERILEQYLAARRQQQRLLDLIGVIGTHNLGDARVNHLVPDARALMNYISTYLEPLERRKIQLESVITTATTDTTSSTIFSKQQQQPPLAPGQNRFNIQAPTVTNIYTDNQPFIEANGGYSSFNGSATTTSSLREISNFNDLNLAENWLNLKIEQLNSSLLSSLGASISDTRTILNKHEQIALECRAIEEATLTFNGRNIHAIKEVDPKDDKSQGDKSLFEQQKLLAQRVKDVITILDARIVLLRRAIDFYLRSKEATGDINRMMRRLQVDNSLQSVQYVSNELELRDVSSVVASGATVISELQQLQLAQQHGQRSRLVNLNLMTNGIRSIIDQLNQDLAHLKTVLNQRRLVSLNEDATKMATNFSNKCHQLYFWLNSHVKSFLLANNRLDPELAQVRDYCDSHEQLRLAVQNKTLEVEALLRSLPTLTEHFNAKSRTADEIQRATDELRQDWISMTNCLDRRIEFARKYLAILNTVALLRKELSSLENFLSGSVNLTGSGVNDERTDEEILSNIDQSLAQLANQVKNFNLDSKRINTELVCTPTIDGRPIVNDVNKKSLVGHADSLLREFEAKRCALDDDSLEAQRGRSQVAQLEGQQGDKQQQQPAHKRPQQVDPPRFVRTLEPEQAVEPFSVVELECKTDCPCQVDWFMGNNFKKIPQTIKHFTSSENNQHKLTISDFNPICCGVYVARATNSAGQAVSQCRLRLAGIQEDDGASSTASQQQQQRRPISPLSFGFVMPSNGKQLVRREETIRTTTATTISSGANHSLAGQMPESRQNFQTTSASPAAFSTTSSFSQWRPTDAASRAPAASSQQKPSAAHSNGKQSETTSVSRVIRGVESSERDSTATPSMQGQQQQPRELPTPSPQYQPARHQMTVRISQVTSATSGSDTDNARGKSPSLPSNTFPVTQTTYSGPSRSGSSKSSNLLKVSNTTNNNNGRYYTESPVSSASFSRSISRSPLEGAPQPPVFVQPLTDTMPHSCSRAGLVCLVVGNPPPTIEWLHNNQTIATTKCYRPPPGQVSGACSRGNICKLTIETVNNKTQGQYVCRASNRAGKTSTGLTLNK